MKVYTLITINPEDDGSDALHGHSVYVQDGSAAMKIRNGIEANYDTDMTKEDDLAQAWADLEEFTAGETIFSQIELHFSGFVAIVSVKEVL